MPVKYHKWLKGHKARRRRAHSHFMATLRWGRLMGRRPWPYHTGDTFTLLPNYGFKIVPATYRVHE